jgi:protein SCO1/2
MNRRALFSSFASRAPREPEVPSWWFERFGNATLRTHEGESVRYYDDLIKGKQVVINMMYATCEGQCPIVTSNLVKVHHALKGRMGKDLFFYSITVKPEDDDPVALKDFAEMHRALLPGWLFLTGDPYDIETIRYRLFRHDHILFDTDISTHVGKVRIVNDNTRRWTHANPFNPTYSVLKRIAWADPPNKTWAEQVEANKKLQERINEDVKKYGYRKTV